MVKRLTDTEWIILRALWEGSPKALKDIVKSVQKQQSDIEWHYKTYHTYLSNMCAKGLIGFDVSNVRTDKLYYPIITLEEALKAESESLISRINLGSVGTLVAMLADSHQLSARDQKDLMELVARLEKEEGK